MEMLKVKTEVLKVNFTNYADNPIYRHLSRAGNPLPAIYGHSNQNSGVYGPAACPPCASARRPSVRPGAPTAPGMWASTLGELNPLL